MGSPISGSAGSGSSPENSTPASPDPRDHRDSGALEDPELRCPVGLERPVPVEVIRLQVQPDRHLTAELMNVLELERRYSQATHSAERIEVSGVPMFPATATSRPAARKIAPSSSHVVDFPFVPVTPTKRVPVGASRLHPSSSLTRLICAPALPPSERPHRAPLAT